MTKKNNGKNPDENAANSLKLSHSSDLNEIFPIPSKDELNNFFTHTTADKSHPEWEPSDLRAILSHQLSAPMVFDFCATMKSWVAAEEIRTWTGERGLEPKTFNDLFLHPSPSTKLLNLTKQFAKANSHHPESTIPPVIAVVLYYTCIAVAFVRLGEWITTLSRVEAMSGFTWVRSQSWVDHSTKDICRQALDGLN